MRWDVRATLSSVLPSFQAKGNRLSALHGIAGPEIDVFILTLVKVWRN
jgi:hypothetical protein